MNNMDPSTGAGDPQDSRRTDPQDSRRTDQFWTPAPGPPGGGPHGQEGPAGPPAQPGQLDQPYARDRRPALRWTAGLSLALVLAAGGVVAGVALASHPPASSAAQASDSTGASNGTGSAAGVADQPQSQAAQLNAVLNAASAPGPLTLTSAPTGPASTSQASTSQASTSQAATGPGSASATTAKARAACRRAVAALRAARRAGRPALARAARAAVIAHCHGLRRRLLRFALLRGIDGQFTFRSKQGTIRTLAFERGVIQSVSGSAVVVRAADGTTWSWDLVSSTVVREHGQKTPASALTSGAPVWVGGRVVSGAKDARLIVIRPPAAPATATPAPSESGS